MIRVHPPIIPKMTVGEVLDMYASPEWFFEEMSWYLPKPEKQIEVKYFPTKLEIIITKTMQIKREANWRVAV